MCAQYNTNFQNYSTHQYNRVKNTQVRPTHNYRHPFEVTREEMENLELIFPCQNPRNPNMVDTQQRRITFSNWPNHHMRATVEELVDAGFLYLNEGDKLKCFYCNGGLQHWQYNEDPWFEHAKWYPNCEYLLQKKGLQYVQYVAEQFPSLKRPVFQQYPQSLPQQRPTSSNSCASAARHSSTHSLPSSSRGIIAADEISESTSSDGQVVSQKPTLQEAMDSLIVKESLRFGFDKDLVSKVVKRKLGLNEEYQGLLELVTDIQAAESDPSFLVDVDEQIVNFFEEPAANDNVLAPNPPPRNIPSSLTNSVESNDSELSDDHSNNDAIKNKIEDIKNEQTCKVCLDRISDCVFVPCGHVCCCVTCASALHKCPICRKNLEKIVKFYR